MTIGWCLLAIATSSAAPSIGYLPATGAALLRFQPTKPAGPPAGLPPLLQPDTRGADLTTVATNSPAPSATDAMDPWFFSPPDTLVPSASAPPPDTASSPTPARPPDSSRPALSPSNDPPLVKNPVADMQLVLSWLLPTSTNTPAGSFLFPVFVPATPPHSSQAVYERQ